MYSFRPSPNHGPRPEGARVELLILHYTGMPSADGALAWLCDERSQVSAHWFVHEDGRIVQTVDESRRAWHAGVSCWRGIRDVNAHSIGVEIANPGHEFGYRPFPEAQIDAVIALCRGILSRHPIAPRDVLAHSDVAPTRKEDPGELFPWQRLAAEGIGLWAPATGIFSDESLCEGHTGPAVEQLQSSLVQFGYDAPVNGIFCAKTVAVVTAFQRHFRPSLVNGIADGATQRTVKNLLDEVDRPT